MEWVILGAGSLGAVGVWWLVEGFVGRQVAACCPEGGGGKIPLVSYRQALPYLRGNPHITHGYRQHYSPRMALRSLFALHNETANIWSHLLGWLLFAYFTLRSVIDLVWADAPQADWIHQIALTVYCWGALTLLACSTSFHWIGCVSDQVYALTAKLDYSAIAILILVSFFPFMYSLFYCRLPLGLFYSFAISAITVGALYVSWSETFSKPGYQALRAGLFIAMGLFGGIPLPHACISIGIDRSWPVLWPLLLMGALYIGGALLYAMQIPERFFPGKLNLIGHSHFLFHCCVVAAACVHYWNIHRLIDWRHAVLGTCG